jgi:hypothetical protein
MTEEFLIDAFLKTFDPAVAVRARAFAGQVRSDGAAVAARQLEVEYGASGTEAWALLQPAAEHRMQPTRGKWPRRVRDVRFAGSPVQLWS